MVQKILITSAIALAWYVGVMFHAKFLSTKQIVSKLRENQVGGKTSLMIDVIYNGIFAAVFISLVASTFPLLNDEPVGFLIGIFPAWLIMLMVFWGIRHASHTDKLSIVFSFLFFLVIFILISMFVTGVMQ